MDVNRNQATRAASTLGRLVVAALLMGATACTDSPEPLSPTTASPSSSINTASDPTTSSLANETTTAGTNIDYREYVETALELMERFYYAADQVDWGSVREAALDDLAADPAQEEAYGAIRDALLELGDPHSRFEPPQMRQDLAELGGETPEPTGERIGQAGFLRLPGITNHSIDPDDPKFYADRVRELLKELDTPEPACGWIIDLRGNAGGTAGPMLASLGPLLGQGIVLTASGPAGTQIIEVRADHLVSPRR